MEAHWIAVVSDPLEVAVGQSVYKRMYISSNFFHKLLDKNCEFNSARITCPVSVRYS